MPATEAKTNQDKYNPTQSEILLLDILLNPEHRGRTITDICELAGVSRDIYYKAFKKPEFVEHYRDQSKMLISHALGPVINACVDAAKSGSHPHIKTVLEMAGLHLDKMGLVGGDGKQLKINVNFTDERFNTK